MEESVELLERWNRRLTVGMFGLIFVFIVSLGGSVVFWKNSIQNPGPVSDKILRARGLVIVDAKGTERVWIGAPVPEPLVLGKRLPRGGDVRGILLCDEEGNERSGYVTGELIQTLQGNTMTVTSVSFAPDGKRMASSSLDRTIRIWKLE
jgi:WD40 repeat protein